MDSSKAEVSTSSSHLHDIAEAEGSSRPEAFGTVAYLDFTKSVTVDYATLESHSSCCCDTAAGKLSVTGSVESKTTSVLLRRPYINANHRHMIWNVGCSCHLTCSKLTLSHKHLVDEIRTWFWLKHNNIHSFMGFILESNVFFLVSAWENRGFLSQYVAKNENINVTQLVRTSESTLRNFC